MYIDLALAKMMHLNRTRPTMHQWPWRSMYQHSCRKKTNYGRAWTHLSANSLQTILRVLKGGITKFKCGGQSSEPFQRQTFVHPDHPQQQARDHHVLAFPWRSARCTHTHKNHETYGFCKLLRGSISLVASVG